MKRYFGCKCVFRGVSGSGVACRRVGISDAILTPFPTTIRLHNIHFRIPRYILGKNVLKNLRGQKTPTDLHKDTDYYLVTSSQILRDFQKQMGESPEKDAREKVCRRVGSNSCYERWCEHIAESSHLVRHTKVVRVRPTRRTRKVQSANLLI